MGHGLWGVVSGEEAEPDKEQKQQHDEWIKKNALALHAIQLSCGAGIYSKIDKAHISAHYAWTHLAEKALGPLPRPPPSSDHQQQSQLLEDNGKKISIIYILSLSFKF